MDRLSVLVTELRAKIESWDGENILDLYRWLRQLASVAISQDLELSAYYAPGAARIPTHPIPENVSLEELWAMDASGNCLIGATLERLQVIDERKLRAMKVKSQGEQRIVTHMTGEMEMEKRNVSVRLTKEEHSQVRQLAALDDVSLGEWIRLRVLRELEEREEEIKRPRREGL